MQFIHRDFDRPVIVNPYQARNEVPLYAATFVDDSKHSSYFILDAFLASARTPFLLRVVGCVNSTSTLIVDCVARFDTFKSPPLT